MKSALLRYATPFITGLFLVSLVSGVALFFHVGPAGFHGMHEWLSVVLIIPFLLHLWKNWRPMTAYFKRGAFAIAMVVSVGAAAVFLMPTQGETGGGRPAAFALSTMIMKGSVAEVAAILDTSPEGMTDALTNAGYTVSSADQSLTDVAAASGKTEMDIAGTLVSLGQ
ncbi:DUF4405 domain-containing protein [Donghicola mangrovi]|uniref:DUF4405 domain-containing protein n=1 Tax=Donghicola mangrovi TaxID=2729614 RepID=A0A850QF63_9RHOB|nr:DUF4405 domain-containing protein [Donghicola mangrovi]NVO25025.1 DUF4405 domain-containing protein [Donghicola mangrovi]